MFNDEFEGLPPALTIKMKAQIESVVRKMVASRRTSLADPSKPYLTDVDASGILFAVFDLASRLKHPGSDGR